MTISAKIAAHFGVEESELSFRDEDYFAFSSSCTVGVRGVPFDVWFDAGDNIIGSARA